ncbi:DUF3144 domain-containing protein [Sulfitobacter mediterraneus]|uniref:DUF3144 domain-containing protein n=1 Tax=Sulfitobacter mediterraneus TaxID=83219 RepID=A0A061SRH3_9RHOB|nr:DUF3144 domain-containing protein [Sulfitobacter mediterraneus]KAJ03492.1 hypothetical protein PM02_09120 [Sulfitobacter mediterraneus]
MSTDWDKEDFARADEIINLANSQLRKATKGKVSAALMFASARYCSWVSATGFSDGAEMASMREQTIDYFVDQYREALTQNLDDYIEGFTDYMSKD